MRLTIKNAGSVCINAALQPNRVDVGIEGIKTEDLLRQVDITTAIDYYGVIELLDNIGEEEVRIYVDSNRG